MPVNPRTPKNRLGEARKNAGYTQKAVSVETGIPLGTIRRWEQGQNDPDMSSLVTLAKLYDTSLDYILENKPETQQSETGVETQVKKMRERAGLTQKQLAEKIGTSQQQIARFEAGTEVRASTLVKLSEALDVSISSLLGLTDALYPRITAPGKLPVVGRIAAGTPNEAIYDSGSYKDTEESLLLAHPHAFWLTVNGNSMNRLFPDGTLVLIDPDAEVRNGDVAVVFVNGDDATIKRVYFEEDAIRLHPESYDSEYVDRIIGSKNHDAPSVRIIGKAVSYTAPDGWRA